MNKIDLTKIKTFKLSISACLAILIAFTITIVTTIFIIIAMMSTEDIMRGYKNDIDRLKNHHAAVLAHTIKADTKKNIFNNTKNLLAFYKSEELISYLYIENNETGEIVVGKEDYQNLDKLAISKIKKFSKEIGKYTFYCGMPESVRTKNFTSDFFTLVAKIMFFIIIVGIFASMIFTSVISKPLTDISKAAKKMTDGNFDVEIKESKFSELNELIDSYNEMAFQLRELYSSLELKVIERTIALKTANEKLQETQAMMVHSEKMRSLGELVAGIAHEINNPINFIHGNIMILENYVRDLLTLIDTMEENNSAFSEEAKAKIESLKKDIDLDFLRDDVKDLIRSCIEGTERTKNIVLDLKNFSRMEEMVLTQFDIPKEIDTTLNILNNKYKNRITVIKNYAQDTPKIEAYGGQLNQVFMNILDNAQDAMGEIGTLTINTYKQDYNAIIEFIDTGSGIPEENLKKIFDPFFTTKAVGKGTGLGMSISYRVINDHNGKIEVESEVGKGTKFKITLPVCHDQQVETMEEEIIRNLREENGV